MKKTELHTTFQLLHDAKACKSSYRKLAKALGGIKKYGRNTPINLLKILDTLNVQDCLWCLPYTIEDSTKIARLMSCDFAESVLHLYEDIYPDDNRPRFAIKISRLYAHGKAKNSELAAAWEAARAAAAGAAEEAAWAAARAARAAAWEAARAAAREAAWAEARAAWEAAGAAWAVAGAAEIKKQEKIIRKYLK